MESCPSLSDGNSLFKECFCVWGQDEGEGGLHGIPCDWGSWVACAPPAWALIPDCGLAGVPRALCRGVC